MIIRSERASDVQAIWDVTVAAFTNHPHSQNTEQFIINALRAAGALAISLVAEIEGRVVGHIAFSRVAISDASGDWYGVGPVSVLPERQGQGIGTALMNEGLSMLRARGTGGCVLVGEPGYYQRFGFRNLPVLVLEGVPHAYFLALPMGDLTARGTVVFHEAFTATS